MKKFLKVLAIGVCATMLVSCGGKESSTTVDMNRVYSVGTNAEYPPFEYLENGKISGLDAEIIELISQKTGIKYEWKNMNFDGLIPALQTKKIDVVIAGMSITPERSKAVNFSIPYLTSNVTFLANKNNPINGEEDLKNRTYGAELGTTKEAAARKVEGATVVPFTSNTAALVALKSGKVDGFLLLFSKDNDPIVEYLNKINYLYAIIGKPSKNINSTIYIDNDNIIAGKDATDFLINSGHSDILFLYNNGNRIFVQDRKMGYITSLLENNIKFKPELCLEKNLNLEKDIKDIEELFLSENSPTAVITIDDILALSLEKILSSLGKKVPEDVSIITFNNSLLTTLTNPQLTCIDINNYQLGWEGAAQIIKHIHNSNLIPTKIIVPHMIIARDSCKKIK